MIFLSKRGQDEYVNMLAAGCGQAVTPADAFDFDSSDEPVLLRGITNKVIKRCLAQRRDFYYMDSGYMGNRPYARNPSGWKWYHRIVPNDLQHDVIIPRPDDRWKKLGLSLAPWRRSGRTVLVVAPDGKACKFYGTTPEQWIENTLSTVKAASDRPVLVRERVADPGTRTRDSRSSFASVLASDVFAVVTFNSVAAVESIMAGIPVFVNAPANAARPVANLDLAKIDTPWYPDRDLVYAWACHLAYGQVHIDEMKSGRALDIVLDQHG